MDVEDLLASSLASSLIWKEERNIKSKLIEKKKEMKKKWFKDFISQDSCWMQKYYVKNKRSQDQRNVKDGQFKYELEMNMPTHGLKMCSNS